MLLTFSQRASTRDVDAVIGSDPGWLRSIVADIAAERDWPPDWLNDGVKGWLSAADTEPGAKELFRTYPDEDRPGLRVFIAAPTYLFAMKWLAMRIGGVEVTSDRQDIEMLARAIGIGSAREALDIVSRFYPSALISPKTQFGIEEIFGSRP